LIQADQQSLPERVFKHRVTGFIDEIGEDDGYFSIGFVSCARAPVQRTAHQRRNQQRCWNEKIPVATMLILGLGANVVFCGFTRLYGNFLDRRDARRRIVVLKWADEAIASAWHSFYEAGVFRGIV